MKRIILQNEHYVGIALKDKMFIKVSALMITTR